MGFESSSRKRVESSPDTPVDPAEVLSALEKLRRVTNRTKAAFGAAALSSVLAAPAEASWIEGGPKVTREDGVKHVSDEGHVFQLLFHDGGTVWRVEYVPKESAGGLFYAQRLIKINETTGERAVVGEFDSVFDVASAAETSPEWPQEVRDQLQAAALPVRAEKERQEHLRADGSMSPSEVSR